MAERVDRIHAANSLRILTFTQHTLWRAMTINQFPKEEEKE